MGPNEPLVKVFFFFFFGAILFCCFFFQPLCLCLSVSLFLSPPPLSLSFSPSLSVSLYWQGRGAAMIYNHTFKSFNEKKRQQTFSAQETQIVWYTSRARHIFVFNSLFSSRVAFGGKKKTSTGSVFLIVYCRINPLKRGDTQMRASHYSRTLFVQKSFSSHLVRDVQPA